MSKIPFTLDTWLKDKSQKIETTFGEPAKVVFTEGLGKCPILAIIYDGDTTDSAWFTKDGKSHDGVYGLFLVTPDEELTDFEHRLCEFTDYIISSVWNSNILKLTNEQIIEGWSEDLLALAKQQFLQSCELMTQEHHKKLMETLCEECKKDLPRWCVNVYHNSDSGVSVDWRKGEAFICYKGKIISLKDLEKLPGFKED